MKRRSKIVILIFILLIPAAIYIFLRSFGQNEFSVPIYNADGELETISIDADNNPNHHKVVFNNLIDKDGHPVDTNMFLNKIVILDLAISHEKVERDNYQINRIADIFKDENAIHIIRIINTDQARIINTKEHEAEHRENISLINMDRSTILEIADVKLGLEMHTEDKKGMKQLILLDEEKRIRGYYNLNDFDDVDRLVLEVKILLNLMHNV